MRNQEKKSELTLEQAIQPIVVCQLTFSDQRMLVSEMYATTVANAPDNETDNFTARRLQGFYLSLLQTLENLESISQIDQDNCIMLLDRVFPEFRKF